MTLLLPKCNESPKFDALSPKTKPTHNTHKDTLAKKLTFEHIGSGGSHGTSLIASQKAQRLFV